MITHNIPFSISKNYPKYSKSAYMGNFQGTKNEQVTLVVNEPSVFEPLNVYYN